jgi:thiosulfate dehydrogenase
MARRLVGLALSLLAAGGCGEAPPPRAAAAYVPDTVPFQVPSDSTIPPGLLGEAIRRGRALLEHTADSLPEYVGNTLACTSCHPAAGTLAGGMPWVGVYGQFPQYRSRAARVQVIEDRLDDCFIRSMNGKPLPRDGKDVRDIVAYFAFLSRDIPVGARVEGQGLPRVDVSNADSTAGKALYATECARCHGEGGGGYLGPALWGDSSFNIGAGMARLRTAAGFIRANMPMDRRGSLTDEQAADLAAYLVGRPRPDLPGKEYDWPNGDPPPDAAYPTLGKAAGDR